jgi:quercetin dioxygenase-like cupin family protein
MKLPVLGIAIPAMIAIVGGAYAQQRGAPRTIFQRADSAVPGYEVIAAGAEFAPGATTGWHTHPGEMVGYVLEGTFVVEQEGKSAVTLDPGQSFIVPAGTVHTNTNNSGTTARMLATYIVEKGKPLNSQVAR